MCMRSFSLCVLYKDTLQMCACKKQTKIGEVQSKRLEKSTRLMHLYLLRSCFRVCSSTVALWLAA